MGSVMSYFNYVYVETHDGPSSMSVVGHLEKWRPLGEGSLTVMTVVQDGPS